MTFRHFIFIVYSNSLNMNELSRKEQNFIQREQELIYLALDILRENGLSGLTMDKLTAHSDYSKGTIYNHFSCKEDVLSAIGISCLVELDQLFSRAMAFQGNTRERLIAVHFSYMLHARLKPEQFMCVLSCKTAAVAEKASKQHRQLSINKENKLLESLNNLVIEAKKNTELDFKKLNLGDDAVNAVTFSIWSMSFGSLSLLMNAVDSPLIKKMNRQDVLLNNINITLDGLNWRPLSSQWNYNEIISRIKNEIFAEEVQALNQQSEEFVI